MKSGCGRETKWQPSGRRAGGLEVVPPISSLAADSCGRKSTHDGQTLWHRVLWNSRHGRESRRPYTMRCVWFGASDSAGLLGLRNSGRVVRRNVGRSDRQKQKKRGEMRWLLAHALFRRWEGETIRKRVWPWSRRLWPIPGPARGPGARGARAPGAVRHWGGGEWRRTNTWDAKTSLEHK